PAPPHHPFTRSPREEGLLPGGGLLPGERGDAAAVDHPARDLLQILPLQLVGLGQGSGLLRRLLVAAVDRIGHESLLGWLGSSARRARGRPGALRGGAGRRQSYRKTTFPKRSGSLKVRSRKSLARSP